MSESIETALQTLKQANYRITKQRRHLLALLAAQSEHYIDITTLDDQMRQAFTGVSHNTIYRNLAEFAALGLVEITRRSNGQAVKFRCERPHHHHFICQTCGRVLEIQMPKWDPSYYEQQLPGAKITGHNFELYGQCPKCANRQKS